MFEKLFRKHAKNTKREKIGDKGDEPRFNISENNEIIVFPKIKDLTKVNVIYPLIKPFVNAHIVWDDFNKELVYKIEEPNLDDREQEVFYKLKEGLEEKLDVGLSNLDSRKEIISYLKRKIGELIVELGLKIYPEEYAKIMYFIYRDFVGLNQIEPFMHDPYIEDVGTGGTGHPVFVVHTKFGNLKSNVVIYDEAVLKNLVVKLAERCGKYISYAEPLLDGSLPDGSRVNASLTSDVTARGPTFSIRKFHEIPFSAIDMLDLRTANLDIMAYMWLAIEYRRSLLIAGGSATGKTSFLNSVVSFIPPEEKIVSIEDTRELKLTHENWIPAVARPGYGFGDDTYGEIDMFRLLKESFRQNPDYVIVGEVRGEEASVLFQGMASGHPSIGTVHASSPNTVIKRLVTPPINLSPTLVETLDLIVIMKHAREHGKNARRVGEIHEIEKIDRLSVRSNEIFAWTSIDDSFEFKGLDNSHLMDDIKAQYGISQRDLELEMKNRKKVLKWMQLHRFTRFDRVSRIVSEYYKDKQRVLAAIERDEAPHEIEDIQEKPYETKRRVYEKFGKYENIPQKIAERIAGLNKIKDKYRGGENNINNREREGYDSEREFEDNNNENRNEKKETSGVTYKNV